ncbi:MAG: FAD-dependent oxidoreductase [Bacillota bacterium]
MPAVVLTIDGKEVQTEKGKTVLAAALEAGIYIPHLCRHPDLAPLGACRLCLVEIEGRPGPVASCTTPAEDKMVVKTRTPQQDRLRRLALELILAAHPPDCTACPKYLKCELQSLAQYLGITDQRLRRRQKPFPVNTGNPLFVHDFTRCILCGRCVQACNELRGAGVLNFVGRGRETHIGTAFGLPLAEAGCRFCGACVEACPTGALRDKEEALLPGKNRQEALVPCRSTCPAQIDIPRYVRYIKEGKYPEAAAVIREKVPFPAVLGRVCNHPCEANCRRGKVNAPVAIRELKRFAAARDDGRRKKNTRKPSSTGRRVAVVGAGPAGLTAAYCLARLGHGVTVFEALPLPGGMLRVGIPAYRLPKEILDAEIKEIEEAGVEIKTGAKVTSLDPLFKEGYSAVLVAAGTHRGQKLSIPGAGLPGVLTGVDFLRAVNLGAKVPLGKKVLVLGGGNVAFDCARVALRLGAAEVLLACLEPAENMLADPEEIVEAKEEGVVVYPSRTFTGIVDRGGRPAGVACREIRSFSFDEEGRLRLDVVEGSEHILPADTVIFATGQRPEVPPEFGLATGRGGVILADPETLSTGKEGVFAAGDAVTGTASVVAAVAAGRKAAAAIDRYLGGDAVIDEKLAPAEEPSPRLGREEGFAFLPRRQAPLAPAEERHAGFAEAACGLGEEDAREEARRCLQCDLRLKISPVKFWADYSLRK